jgi:hypothetical protein
MLFLVPLLSSAFVFVVSKTTMGHLRTVTIALVGAAALFVLLGFISAIRAVAVKTSETLSLTSVLLDNGQFRAYDEAFHAKRLLYCASMNTAMNDHIAQFVRGVHSMTSTAVLLLILASQEDSKVTCTVSLMRSGICCHRTWGTGWFFIAGKWLRDTSEAYMASLGRTPDIEASGKRLRAKRLAVRGSESY